MKKIFQIYLLMVFIVPSQLFGEEPKASQPLSDILALANENNPLIKASRQKWKSVQYSVSSEKTFPDPMIQYVKFTDELQTRGGPLEEKYSVSQKIPFFGRRRKKGTIAEQNAFVAEQAYKSRSLEVFSQVTEAYTELYYIDQSLLITDELADQLRRFSRVAERKYSVGKSYQASVLRANVELAKILNDLTTLEQQRQSALARLNSLLNRDPAEPLVPAIPSGFEFPYQRKNLEQVALLNRPEMLAAHALVKREEAARSLAVKNYFPDLTVTYEVSKVGAGTTSTTFDGEDAHALGFKINVPLWVNGTSAEHKRAKAEQVSSEFLLENWTNQTRYQVSDLVTRVETAKRLVGLYKKNVLPQANEALKSSQRGYEADHISFLELLDSIRMLLKFELEYRRYQADFVQAKVRLEKVLGVPLSQLVSQSGEKDEK